MKLTVKNYRAFADSNPATFAFGRGFTAFLGANNSGKSSILRFFYELRGLFLVAAANPGELGEALQGRFRAFNPATSIRDINELFYNGNGRDLSVEIELDLKGRAGVADRLVLTVQRATNQWRAEIYEGGGRLAAASVDSAGQLIDAAGVGLGNASELLAACRSLTSTLYIGPFRNVVNIGSAQDYFDMQLGQAFVERWRQIKTGVTKKDNEAADELTEQVRRVFRYSKLEINASADAETLTILANGRSYRLGELGAGITQFILVLVNAAIAKPAWILIDEPETSLHASLQVDFMTTIGSYATEGVGFATHSIGLARATAEHVYTTEMTASGRASLRPFDGTARLSEVLGELGFSGYRDLGYRKVLLVEGITDVKTVQQFLRVYKKDHDVVLLPLGGSEMFSKGMADQLEEVKRLSPEVYAIIDSERTAPGEPLSKRRQEFVDVCRAARVDCHVLERRAIENYFSIAAIRAVHPLLTELAPYESRSGRSTWPKEDNWRIAAEMPPGEVARTDLGKFLRRL